MTDSSAFAARSRAHESRTQAFFARVCAEPALHARFLNTLSMMEHIGSRKIMVTQRGAALDQGTLKHLAEETRHAFFLKRHAEAIARRKLSYAADDVMAPASARMYFQRLDTAVRAAVGNGPAAYLFMSMIVELRAVWGYRLYQAALARAGARLSLKSLLAEESHHLDDMAERLAEEGLLEADVVEPLLGVEARAFDRLLSLLEHACLEAAIAV